MQGIFQKENTDKALKYGIYRHLPTYEKIIRNLVSFCCKKYDKKAGRYYLEALKSTNEDIVKSYHGLEYNCVQVSMEVLLKGTYYGSYQVYYNEIFCWYNKPWYSNFILMTIN